ncbi:DUF2987 domain-containing protein [Psychromonas sp. MME2]
MRRFALFISLFCFLSSANGAPLKLNYSLFFGYMKTLYKLQYEQVTTAFFLVDKNSGNGCLIEQAEMVVDEKREAIAFTQAGRLLPFFSDEHRKDGAIIEVRLISGQENRQCDLQVTLMAKESQLENLTHSKLALISEQLQGVLNKNAGMIGKYFLPDFIGVRVQPVQPVSAAQRKVLAENIKVADNGDLLISNQFLQTDKGESLINFQVQRITPWLENNHQLH